MEVGSKIQFLRKNILIVSPEPWSHVFVSKHHYALELAKKNNKVYFLNPPSEKRKLEITASPYNNVFVVDYSVPVKGMRFLPGFLRRNIDRKTYNSIQRKAGIRFHVIWNFENSRFYDFRFAPDDVLAIYHQVDLNQDFHPQLAAKTADICFCTTDFIKEKLLKYNTRVYKLHHGVSSNAFLERNELTDREEPGKKIRVAYIGSLDIPYLDVQLLKSLIEKFPNIEFVLVGPYQKRRNMYQLLSAFKNVNFTGAVDSGKIKYYLRDSDILLLCYKAEIFREQLANPHKMMEYLASGNITVASYTDEYKDKGELLIMSKTNQDFPDLFQYAIEHLPELNSRERKEKRIAFAMAHTYEKQLNKVEKFINQLRG